MQLFKKYGFISKNSALMKISRVKISTRHEPLVRPQKQISEIKIARSGSNLAPQAKS